MLSKLEHLLNLLSQKKLELDSFRPLPKELVKNLNEWFKVKLTYSSNALEGNTLTLSETALVIEKGLTIGGKTLKEHLEATGHAQAFDYVLELAKQKRSQITLNDILNIHCLIFSQIDKLNAGTYRKILVKISGLNLTLPEPLKVPELMDQFISWLHTSDDHPVIIASKAHLDLVTIHPFVDGNGRTSRLLMNLLLIQAGYPPAIILPEERINYIDCLKEAQENNNYEPFFLFIAVAVSKSLDIYLEHARSTTK